jgi:hypothetical protein
MVIEMIVNDERKTMANGQCDCFRYAVAVIYVVMYLKHTGIIRRKYVPKLVRSMASGDDDVYYQFEFKDF